MTSASLVTSLLTVTLLTLPVAGLADAGSCSRETGKSAVESAAEVIGRLGVEVAKRLIDRKEGQFSCGPYSVKVMDYSGTWRIDPDETSNVGRNVESFKDSAATNFMKGLISASIEQRGKLLSYFTTDTEHGIKINKALYYVDIPQRRVIVYGAFIITQ